MEPWVPGFVTGSLALLAAVLSGVVTGAMQSRRERQKDQRAAGSPGAPTVQEIWQRQDRMERAFRSALVLLGEVADQWDGEHPPVLSKRHMNILAEGGYLPPEFDNLLTSDYPIVTDKENS